MTWSDVFPILSDEICDEYITTASKSYQREAASWFEEQRTINPRKVRHIVSVSLFYKNIRMKHPEIVIKDRSNFMTVARRGKLLRFEPWEHYVKPLLEGAYRIQASGEDAAFRVYLAADLEFLIEDLVAAGCEVRLMKSNSIRHNPGAMWRFLALADTDKLITVLDADLASSPKTDTQRTELLELGGLGWWRVPVWLELNEVGNVHYRPFVGQQFGCRSGLGEIRLMMEALVWATQNGKIDNFAKIPGRPPTTIQGTVWPDYGFDEWFLQAAVYPRAAYDGVLTFIPSEIKTRLIALDIQYAAVSSFKWNRGCVRVLVRKEGGDETNP